MYTSHTVFTPPRLWKWALWWVESHCFYEECVHGGPRKSLMKRWEILVRKGDWISFQFLISSQVVKLLLYLAQWKQSKLERGVRLRVNVATLTHTSWLGKDDLPLSQMHTVEHYGSKSWGVWFEARSTEVPSEWTLPSCKKQVGTQGRQSMQAG